MAEHVAMEQPLAGIVRRKGDLAGLVASQQDRVAHRSERAVGAQLAEMHSVQVHRMWEHGLVLDLQAHRLVQG